MKVPEKSYVVVSRSRITAKDALDAEEKMKRRLRGPGTHEIVRVSRVSTGPKGRMEYTGG